MGIESVDLKVVKDILSDSHLISSLIVCSYLLWRRPGCVTVLWYDYILEINLRNGKKLLMILKVLPNQIRFRGETKSKGYFLRCLQNDWLFCCSQQIKDIANNHVYANKAVHCFQMRTLAFSKYWFKHMEDYSSHFTQKTSKETNRTHTPYADTDVLQKCCLFKSGLIKRCM